VAEFNSFIKKKIQIQKLNFSLLQMLINHRMPNKSHQQDSATSLAVTGGNTAIFAKTRAQIPNAIYDFGILAFYSLIPFRFFFWRLKKWNQSPTFQQESEKWNQSPPFQQDSDDDL